MLDVYCYHSRGNVVVSVSVDGEWVRVQGQSEMDKYHGSIKIRYSEDPCVRRFWGQL